MIMKSMYEGKLVDGNVTIGVNKASLALAVVSLAAAVALFVVGGKYDGFVNIAITMGGVMLAVMAVVKFIGCREYIYSKTNSPLNKHSLHFEISDTTRLRSNLEARNFKAVKEYKSRANSGGARLDVVFSKDGEYAAYRLFVYVPHTYEPVTEVVELETENAADFVQVVKSCITAN
ncbi:MAG: hypothetical protein IKT28_04705 [Rikenellaceae bacterium]|nr:hypothetical protein [Rikenellaceae bacterium]